MKEIGLIEWIRRRKERRGEEIKEKELGFVLESWSEACHLHITSEFPVLFCVAKDALYTMR